MTPSGPTFDWDLLLASALDTPPTELARIAASRPDLHHMLAANPSCYPELLIWLAKVDSPGVKEALASRKDAKFIPVSDSSCAGGTFCADNQKDSANVVDGSVPQVTQDANLAQSQNSLPSTSIPEVQGSYPKRRSRLSGILFWVAGLVLLVLAGGAIWFFTWPKTQPQHSPEVVKVLDLSTIDGTFQLVPLEDSGLHTAKLSTTTVFRISDGSKEVLLGFDAQEGQYPKFATPIPAKNIDDRCQIISGQFSCGRFLFNPDDASFTAEGVLPANQPATETSSTANQTEPTSATSSSSSSSTLGTATTGNSSTNMGNSPSPTTSLSSPPQQKYGETHRGSELTSTSSDLDLQLTVDGKLADSSGQQISDIALTPNLKPRGRKVSLHKELLGKQTPLSAEIAIVSDGTKLLGIKKDTVIWSVDLGNESAELNGFPANPRWVVSDTEIVIAKPDGVFGFNLADGKILWQVKLPVSSWILEADQLLIQSENTLVVAQLNENRQEEPVTITQQDIPALPEVVFPDIQTLGNSTLEIPPACFGIWDRGTTSVGRTTARFTEGTVKEKWFDGDNSGIFIDQSHPSFFDGKPVLLVIFNCYGFDVLMLESIGVYDEKMNLIGSLEPWSGLSDSVEKYDRYAQIGAPPFFDISNIAAFGNVIELTVPHIKTTSDSHLVEDGGSVTAKLLYHWEENQFISIADSFILPDGRTVMGPKTADVQTFYDAVANGDDTYASKFTDAQNLKFLTEAVPLNPLDPLNPMTLGTRRDEVFPKNGEVKTCFPPGPYYFPPIDNTHFGSRHSRDKNLEPGKFICPIDNNIPKCISKDGTIAKCPEFEYNVYLIVQTDATGGIWIDKIRAHFN